MKYIANAHLDEILNAEGLTVNAFAEIVNDYAEKHNCIKASRMFITQLAQNKTVPALEKISTIANALNENGITVNPQDLITFDVDGTTSIKLLALQKSEETYIALVRLQHTSDQQQSAVIGLLVFDLSIKDNEQDHKKGKVITMHLRPYDNEKLMNPVLPVTFRYSFELSEIQTALYSLDPASLRTFSRDFFKEVWKKIAANDYEQKLTSVDHLTVDINKDFQTTFYAVRIAGDKAIFTKSSKDKTKRKTQYRYPLLKPHQVGKLN